MSDGFNYSLHQVEDFVTREFGWSGETASDGAFKCYCPIHGDKSASLIVSLKNGRILIRCLSHGCEQKIYSDISSKGSWPQQLESRAAADEANRRYEKQYPERTQNNEKWNSLRASHSSAVSYQKHLKDTLYSKDVQNPVTFRLTSSYVYTDGEFAHSVIARYDPVGGGKKRIVQHSWGYYDPLPETADYQDNKPRDPNSPRWQWRGWSNDSLKHMVYDVTHLRTSPNATVIIVEGEKAADYFNSRIKSRYPDYVATTWRGGSQNVKNTDWSYISGRDVIVIPDADEPGLIAADHLRSELQGIVASIAVVDIMSFNLPSGWDVGDYSLKNSVAPRFLDLIDERNFSTTESSISEKSTTHTITKTNQDQSEFTGSDPIVADARYDTINHGPNSSGDAQNGELIDNDRDESGFSSADISEKVIFFYRDDKSHIDDMFTYFNSRYARVFDEDKMLVVEMEMIDGQKGIQLIPEAIFRSIVSNIRIQFSNKGVLKPAYDVWVEGNNRLFHGIRYIPRGGRVIHANGHRYLNMWRDYDGAHGDNSGSCELFLDHLRFIADKESASVELYTFMITWMAWMVQRPGSRPGVVLIFRGKQGTGKSIIGKYLMSMIGSACLTTNDLDKVVGKFNSQLLGKVLVLLEEVKLRRNEHHDRIKDLATSDYFSMEAKGRVTTQRDNYLHFIITSNEDYVVPVDQNERRFVPIEVPDGHMQDKEYFGSFTDEMRSGGPQALYKYLSEYQLPSKFPPIPQTRAVEFQRQETSSNSRDNILLQWYALCLKKGALLGGPDGGADIKWVYGKSIERSVMFDRFSTWAADRKRLQISNSIVPSSRGFFKGMRPFMSGVIPSNDASKCNKPLGRFILTQSGAVMVTFPKIGPAKTVFNVVVNNDDSYDVTEETPITENLNLGENKNENSTV